MPQHKDWKHKKITGRTARINNEWLCFCSLIFITYHGNWGRAFNCSEREKWEFFFLDFMSIHSTFTLVGHRFVILAFRKCCKSKNSKPFSPVCSSLNPSTPRWYLLTVLYGIYLCPHMAFAYRFTCCLFYVHIWHLLTVLPVFVLCPHNFIFCIF